jgi:hypothetical protein
MRPGFRRATLAAGALAAGAALAAGCGGGAGSTESASSFVKRITLEFSRGQTGRLWDELHPAEQAVVARTRFIQCERNEGFGLRKVKLLDSYEETIDVAGTRARSTAVSVRVTSDDGITTATLHAVLVDGKWRWILQPADFAVYKRGSCPSG